MRKLVRQDWTSPKNTDVRFIVGLINEIDTLTFYATANGYVRDKYYSKKPE